MLRTLMFFGPALAGGLVLASVWDRHGNGFSRDFTQSPGVIAGALQSLDVRRQPHTLAKLDKADRARMPQITGQRDSTGYSWYVMSGGKSLLKMTAHLEPIDGGAHTRVSTDVERGETGDASGVPDLFKSPSLMAPLFAVAVERALGDFIPRSERSLYSLAERPYGYGQPRQPTMSSAAYSGDVHIEPGKPMVDVSRR